MNQYSKQAEVRAFISLLEVQDQKLHMTLHDRLSIALAHRPGLHADGAVWQLPKRTPKLRGRIEPFFAEDGSEHAVWRVDGFAIYMSGTTRPEHGRYDSDEVVDTTYAIGPAPDNFPRTDAVLTRIEEVHRTFQRRGSSVTLTPTVPRLVSVAEASFDEVWRRPKVTTGERLDGFVLQLALG